MSIEDIKWCDLQEVIDDRGRLTAIEGEIGIPIRIERIFYIHQVVKGKERGGHAHRDTDQVIIGINGGLMVDISDGKRTITFDLNDSSKGLFVPRMLWTRLYDFRDGGVCLVLANTHYDKSKSLRTWQDYISAVEAAGEK